MIYRGNVIEVKNDSLVVMLEDCTFEHVKKFKGLEEGMEIYFEERDIIRKSKSNLKSIALIAASIVLLIATAFYSIDLWHTNYRAIALVSVDINPSVEIKINKKHNVINAMALNEDAKNLPLKNLKGQSIDEALEQLVNMAKIEGYIKEAEENYVLVTSVDLIENTQEQKLLTDLIAVGKEKIESNAIEVGQQVAVIAIQSNKETLSAAKKENISVGKKELNKDVNSKQKDNLREMIKMREDLKEEQVKKLEKGAKELEEKLRELQKINNKNFNQNKYNEIIKEEKDATKDEAKQEKNKIKEIEKQEKDHLKEESKNLKDIEKELKEQEKLKEKLSEQIEKSKESKENKEKEVKEQEKNKEKKVREEQKNKDKEAKEEQKDQAKEIKNKANNFQNSNKK